MPDHTPTLLDISKDSMAAMEHEIGELFNAQAAATNAEALAPRTADATPPSAPGTTGRTPRGTQPAAPTSKPAPTPAPLATTPAAPPSAKVPGPPEPLASATASPVAKGGSVDPAASPSATDPTPDISDIPREYVPGAHRAPQWNKLRGALDHYAQLAADRDAENATLKAQLAATSTPTAPAELTTRLATIEAERNTLQAQLEAVAVERSPRFKAAYDSRRQAAIEQAKQSVSPEHANTIAHIIELPDSAFRDGQLEEVIQAVSRVSTLRAAKLTAAVADLDRIAAERASMAVNSGELYKRWMAEEASARDAQQRQRTTAAESVFSGELSAWSKAGALNEAEVAIARSVYSGQGTDLKDAANASMWAVYGPKVAGQARAALTRVAELEGELGRLRGSQPGLSNGAPSSTAPDDSPDDPNERFSDRMARLAVQEGVFRGR